MCEHLEVERTKDGGVAAAYCQRGHPNCDRCPDELATVINPMDQPAPRVTGMVLVKPEGFSPHLCEICGSRAVYYYMVSVEIEKGRNERNVKFRCRLHATVSFPKMIEETTRKALPEDLPF